MTSLPSTVWRLTLAYSLMMAGTPLMVLVAGIIGTRIAPVRGLATLPVALVVIGVALATLPTGKFLSRWGRRRVFLSYGGIASAAAVVAAGALSFRSFSAFCIAALLFGWAAAAGFQYRFAAIEQVPAELAAKATSLLLLGGILAAFIGPELAVAGRYLLPAEFAGSFLLLIGAYVPGLVLVGMNADSVSPAGSTVSGGRPLREILRQPQVRLAVAAAAMAYAVMSFIMTATPISMHQHSGHSMEATKFVIQSHIVAMYLPSIGFAWLHQRLGHKGLLWLGVAAYVLCLAVALLDIRFINYWVSLVILGVGWNFLFLGGTNLLPGAYRPEERFRVQSMNDFMVFSVQAVVTLGSGWFLFFAGWSGLLWTCVPMLVAFSWLLYRYRTAAFS